ncbi:hypothetical protein [Ruminococcus sp.]|nr:hypothetical protein [Ruminococcus sp.]
MRKMRNILFDLIKTNENNATNNASANRLSEVILPAFIIKC